MSDDDNKKVTDNSKNQASIRSKYLIPDPTEKEFSIEDEPIEGHPIAEILAFTSSAEILREILFLQINLIVFLSSFVVYLICFAIAIDRRHRFQVQWFNNYWKFVPILVAGPFFFLLDFILIPIGAALLVPYIFAFSTKMKNKATIRENYIDTF